MGDGRDRVLHQGEGQRRGQDILHEQHPENKQEAGQELGLDLNLVLVPGLTGAQRPCVCTGAAGWAQSDGLGSWGQAWHACSGLSGACTRRASGRTHTDPAHQRNSASRRRWPPSSPPVAGPPAKGWGYG